jgi:uncharacterized protein YceK
MKNIIILLIVAFSLTIFSGCSSKTIENKIKSYDKSKVKSSAKAAYDDLDKELRK